MRPTFSIVIRLAVASALGCVIGIQFGDHYGMGTHYFELDPAVRRASAITGAVLGLIVGALSATPWIGARAHSVGFVRGTVAATAVCWIGSRAVGGFSSELTPALLAFGLVGGVLGAIGSRRGQSPAVRRSAARESLGSIGLRALQGAGLGLVGGLLIAFAVVGTKPRDLDILLYAYAPILFAIVGIVIGVLVPSARGPISRRLVKARSRVDTDVDTDVDTEPGNAVR